MGIFKTSATTTGAGLALRYVEWRGHGDGLPVLVLHGLAGIADEWDLIARPRAAKRRMLALEARGHGDSDWSAEAAYAGDAHFSDVVGALDGLGIDRCVLVGFSMGGGVAILTAAAAPERI